MIGCLKDGYSHPRFVSVVENITLNSLNLRYLVIIISIFSCEMKQQWHIFCEMTMTL